jgi:Cellulase (glycosyl hydrolase family 5)
MTKTPARSLYRLPALLLLAWAANTALAGHLLGGEVPQATEIPRIRVSDDGKKFAMAGTGRPFVPWGFNYLGQFERLAEDDWDTPDGWRRVEADFREMRKLGANVVRWHLQFETFMKGPDQPDAGQLARLKKLLGLARETGLYLDLTGLNCFRLKRIPAWYDGLPEADRWKTQARFWEAVAETCAGDPAVFCYDLMNEPIIGEAGPKDHPWVGGELGGFHFVQRISNKPAGRDSKDIAEAWVKLLVGAIRLHDKETLVTVGVIPWALVWPGAQPIFYSPQAGRHLDFVSVHFYPATGKLDKELVALAVYDVGKPLVVEETFPLTCSVADLDKFVDAASGRVDGWISHYFGYTPAEHRAGAKPTGTQVAEFLEYWSKKGATIAGAAPP